MKEPDVAAVVGFPSASMTESAIGDILRSLDAAIAGFENNRGRLTPLEVSVKSMLVTSRARLTMELQRQKEMIEPTSRTQYDSR